MQGRINRGAQRGLVPRGAMALYGLRLPIFAVNLVGLPQISSLWANSHVHVFFIFEREKGRDMQQKAVARHQGAHEFSINNEYMIKTN